MKIPENNKLKANKKFTKQNNIQKDSKKGALPNKNIKNSRNLIQEQRANGLGLQKNGAKNKKNQK
jgi:hypothetical protein